MSVAGQVSVAFRTARGWRPAPLSESGGYCAVRDAVSKNETGTRVQYKGRLCPTERVALRLTMAGTDALNAWGHRPRETQRADAIGSRSRTCHRNEIEGSAPSCVYQRRRNCARDAEGVARSSLCR